MRGVTTLQGVLVTSLCLCCNQIRKAGWGCCRWLGWKRPWMPERAAQPLCCWRRSLMWEGQGVDSSKGSQSPWSICCPQELRALGLGWPRQGSGTDRRLLSLSEESCGRGEAPGDWAGAHVWFSQVGGICHLGSLAQRCSWKERP